MCVGSASSPRRFNHYHSFLYFLRASLLGHAPAVCSSYRWLYGIQAVYRYIYRTGYTVLSYCSARRSHPVFQSRVPRAVALLILLILAFWAKKKSFHGLLLNSDKMAPLLLSNTSKKRQIKQTTQDAESQPSCQLPERSAHAETAVQCVRRHSGHSAVAPRPLVRSQKAEIKTHKKVAPCRMTDTWMHGFIPWLRGSRGSGS